jgi:hypothetical protein
MFNLGYYRGGLLPAVYAGRLSLKGKFDRVFKAAFLDRNLPPDLDHLIAG